MKVYPLETQGWMGYVKTRHIVSMNCAALDHPEHPSRRIMTFGK